MTLALLREGGGIKKVWKISTLFIFLEASLMMQLCLPESEGHTFHHDMFHYFQSNHQHLLFQQSSFQLILEIVIKIYFSVNVNLY